MIYKSKHIKSKDIESPYESQIHNFNLSETLSSIHQNKASSVSAPKNPEDICDSSIEKIR